LINSPIIGTASLAGTINHCMRLLKRFSCNLSVEYAVAAVAKLGRFVTGYDRQLVSSFPFPQFPDSEFADRLRGFNRIVPFPLGTDD